MIFPEHCKHVGFASTQPAGEKVYFLSRYLVCDTAEGYEVLGVKLSVEEKGMMRTMVSHQLLATSDETVLYPEPVNLHNRTDLILKASGTGRRCTIFRGRDEHMTFVLDPDPEALLHLHVYDIMPPYPSLSGTLASLEATGLFGDLEVFFEHHVDDIRNLDADVFPCRAAGFTKTLDTDTLRGGERIAGCLTARQIIRECYGEGFEILDICPLSAVRDEPFIARCCRSERVGTGIWNGKFGAVVHWGATPRQIADAVGTVVKEWREGNENRGG